MKTGNIILMLDNSRAADRGFMRGIVAYFHQRGPWSFYRYPPLYMTQPFFPGRREHIITHLKEKNADGFFGYVPHQKVIRKIITSGFPAVVVPVRERIPQVPNIVDEPESVGKMAAEYFLDRGYRHFAFCGLPHYWSNIRQHGFCRRLRADQIEAHVYPGARPARRNLPAGDGDLADWLVGLPKPVGLMACNDDRAFEVLQACQNIGLKVPDRVAVLGVDNDEMVCNLIAPPLSSIALNFEKIGYEAAKILHRIIVKKQQCDDTLRLHPVGLVTRQSTDMLAIDDPDVSAAIRYIRQNARRAIQIQQVVAASTVSLRTLQQRFRRIWGRSINEEIRRARVGQIADMLLHTSFSIQRIAVELEFRDLCHISRIFRKVEGVSPNEYRKKYGHL